VAVGIGDSIKVLRVIGAPNRPRNGHAPRRWRRRGQCPVSQACPLRKLGRVQPESRHNAKEKHMRTMLAALLLAALGLAGCNTIDGVGRDIERGGERLQDSADKRR